MPLNLFFSETKFPNTARTVQEQYPSHLLPEDKTQPLTFSHTAEAETTAGLVFGTAVKNKEVWAWSREDRRHRETGTIATATSHSAKQGHKPLDNVKVAWRGSQRMKHVRCKSERGRVKPLRRLLFLPTLRAFRGALPVAPSETARTSQNPCGAAPNTQKPGPASPPRPSTGRCRAPSAVPELPLWCSERGRCGGAGPGPGRVQIRRAAQWARGRCPGSSRAAAAAAARGRRCWERRGPAGTGAGERRCV